MKIAVLNIGNELLKGSIVNTNLATIGQELIKLGVPPVLQITVNDTRHDILSVLSFIETQNIDVIISSGGLGPTTDDITVETFAEYFNLTLSLNSKIVEHIKTIISSKKSISLQNQKQAMIPDNSYILTNRNGTAPGLRFSVHNKTIFLLPGPPSELIPMLKEEVIIYINSLLKERIFFKSIYVVGIAESELQRIITENLGTIEDLYIAYRAEPGGCELTFSSVSQTLVLEITEKVRLLLNSAVLKDNCNNIVEEIILRLKKNNLTLGLAESCTGGMIGAKITDVSGASVVYKGAIVSYSNEIKKQLLGVTDFTLMQYGAVSSECVLEMVEGCCKLLNTSAGIAISGIAGPDGGSEEKPVGLIFIAVKVKDKTVVSSYNIKGDRNRIRTYGCFKALCELRKLLTDIEKS